MVEHGIDFYSSGIIDESLDDKLEITSSLIQIQASVPVSGSIDHPFQTLPDYSVSCIDSGGLCPDPGTTDPVAITRTYTGADLNTFLGFGDLQDISVSMFFALNDFSSENIDMPEADVWAEFNATAEIEYNFSTVVPVPASVWLLGSGLLGLVGIARRRKTA